MAIYVTKEWRGFGKQNYFWNEYRLEGGKVVMYKCHRQRRFDGDESAWYEDEREVNSWDIDSPDLPQWLKSYI